MLRDALVVVLLLPIAIIFGGAGVGGKDNRRPTPSSPAGPRLMTEYFARQLTGSRCGPYNCAAASGAMASMFALGEAGITADEFPKRSGVSCVPGENSKSGGLFISDVERTAATYGVSIDYGRGPGSNQPKRWSEADAKTRLSGDFVGIFLGDYDQMGADSAQPSFKGDHSALAHDLRASDDTVCGARPAPHEADPDHVEPADEVLAQARQPGPRSRGLHRIHKEEDVATYSVSGVVSATFRSAPRTTRPRAARRPGPFRTQRPASCSSARTRRRARSSTSSTAGRMASCAGPRPRPPRTSAMTSRRPPRRPPPTRRRPPSKPA